MTEHRRGWPPIPGPIPDPPPAPKPPERVDPAKLTDHIMVQFDEDTLEQLEILIEVAPERFGTTLEECASQLFHEAMSNREFMRSWARSIGVTDAEFESLESLRKRGVALNEETHGQ